VSGQRADGLSLQPGNGLTCYITNLKSTLDALWIAAVDAAGCLGIKAGELCM
jgi:hypothetical protein